MRCRHIVYLWHRHGLGLVAPVMVGYDQANGSFPPEGQGT